MNRLPSTATAAEHGEAATVDRRGDDVAALEAFGLRQMAGDRDGDQQPDQRDDVDEAPARRSPRSASGSEITAMPAPSPLAIASTLTA